MTPVRFVVATYNIWGLYRWPEREEALRGFLTDVRPDILALQEFRPETRDVIDEELHDFERVDDPFEGWTREGNIYWYKGLFEKVEHGAEDIGILEPLRRLFWVRLRIAGPAARCRRHGPLHLGRTQGRTGDPRQPSCRTGGENH